MVRPVRAASSIVAVVLAAVASLAIALSLVPACGAIAASTWVLLAGLAALCLVPTALLLRDRAIFAPAPMVLLVLAFTFVVRPVLLLCGAGADSSLHSLGVPSDILRETRTLDWTLALVIAYVGVFVAAYHFSGPRLARGSSRPASAWPMRNIVAVAIALGIAGILTWIALMIRLGASPATMFAESHRLRLELVTIPGLYFVRNFAIWAIWATFWLPFAAQVASGRPFTRRSVILHAALFMVAAAWTIQFGQRYYVVAPALGVLAVLALNRGRLPHAWTITFLVGVPLVSALFSIYRNLSFFGRTTIAGVIGGALSIGLLGMVQIGVGFLSGSFETFLLVVRDYGRTVGEFQYGRTYLGLLWLIIPRSIFPQKPAYPDSYLTELFHAPPGPPTTGLAFGALSEHYINFGAVGILAAGVIVGVLLRALEEFLRQNRERAGVLMWYGQVAYILPLALVVGGWYSVTLAEILFYTVLTAALVFALSRYGSSR